MKKLVTSFAGTLVVDADGLFALKEENVRLATCPGRLILTPHVGEFAHLTGLSPAEIEERRIDAAIRFAVDNHVVLVLKGAPTVTAMPDGSAFVNFTGNLHGLAGDLAAEKTPVGYRASDLAELVPAARAEVMKTGR